LKKFSLDGQFAQFAIDQNLLKSLKSDLEDNITLIETVLSHRNKVYAHTDKDYKAFFGNEPTFLEFESLISLVKKIITLVYKTVYKNEYAFPVPLYSLKDFDVLDCIAKLERQRNKNI